MSSASIVRYVVRAVAAMMVVSSGTAADAGTIACTADGYAAMGPVIYNTSNSYVLVPNLHEEPSGETEAWGFAFFQFDISSLTADVSSASLVLRSIYRDYPGMFGGVNEDYPASVDVYDGSALDFSTFESPFTRAAIHDALQTATAYDTVVVSTPEVSYAWNIAAIVNSARAASLDQVTLVLSTQTDLSDGHIACFYQSEGLTDPYDPVMTYVAASLMPGDANGDDSVNGTDLNTVLSNYNATFTGDAWAFGDFNGDGSVNGSDLNTVLSNYNQSASAASAVPEPNAICLIGATLIGLGLARILRNRRRCFLSSVSPLRSRSA